MGHHLRIAFRLLGDQRLKTLGVSSALSSSRPITGNLLEPTFSIGPEGFITRPKLPPLLTHWAVALYFDDEYLGYEKGWYYYGLVTREDNSSVCVINFDTFDSLAKSGQCLQGGTNSLPHEIQVLATTIMDETPPYDFMSNNCQDFAIELFFNAAYVVHDLERTIEILEKGHGGIMSLISCTRDETGKVNIYNRRGKLIHTQYVPKKASSTMPRSVAYAPGGPFVEGGPYGSDANREEMDVEAYMNADQAYGSSNY